MSNIPLPVSGTQLTLDRNLIGNNAFGQLLDNFNAGAALVITFSQRNDVTGGTNFIGTALFLHAPALPVNATLYDDGQVVTAANITFEFYGSAVPDQTWRFSTGFPDLPSFGASAMGSAAGGTVPLLDLLTFSRLTFQLVTARSVPNGQSVSAGLLFEGTCDLTGWFGPFAPAGAQNARIGGRVVAPPASADPTPPLPFRIDPWAANRTVPGIVLETIQDLGGEFTLFGTLRARNLGLHVYCPPSAAWLEANDSYPPVVALTADINLQSNPPKDMHLSSTIGRGLKPLNFSATFDPAFPLGALADLSNLFGSADPFAALPADIREDGASLGNQIELREAGLTLGQSLMPTGVHFKVGLPNVNFQVAGAFGVSGLEVGFSLPTPAAGGTFSLDFSGRITVGGVPFDIWVQWPDGMVLGSLAESQVVSLSSLLTGLAAVDVPEFSVDTLDLTLTGASNYSFNGVLSKTTPWSLAVGGTTLTISDVQLLLVSSESGGKQAGISGTLALGDAVHVGVNYAIPNGAFAVRGDFAEIKLSEILSALNLDAILPDGFDLDFTQTWIQIESRSDGYSFSCATQIAGFGQLMLVTRAAGYAFGYDLGSAGLADVSSLSSVAGVLQNYIGLTQLSIVVSSFAADDFQFPNASEFSIPELGDSRFSLPPQAGRKLATGALYVYARFGRPTGATSDPALIAIAKAMGFAVDGSVAIALKISVPNPSNDSRLILSFSDFTIGGSITITGQCGVGITASQPTVFLTGTATTPLRDTQNQPVVFSLETAVLPNGVIVSAAMQGGPVSLGSFPIQIANVALKIGLDWEGVPSLGFAGTFAVEDFTGSVAFFFDSVTPQNSLVAGSISGASLRDIAEYLAGQGSLQSGDLKLLGDTLAEFGLQRIGAFTITAATAPSADAFRTALEHADFGGIATAFRAHGYAAFPTTAAQTLLFAGPPRAPDNKTHVWHLTDLLTMKHFTATAQDDGSVQVDLDPQFYFAANGVRIGPSQGGADPLSKLPGMSAIGEVDQFLIHEKLDIEINASSGIKCNVDIDPIEIPLVVADGKLLQILSATSDTTGPHLSLCTFTDPIATADLREPHFLLSGSLCILGLKVSSTLISIGAGGLSFDFDRQLPGVGLRLAGSFFHLTDFSATGSATVGIDKTVDFGAPLGSVHLQILQVAPTLTFGFATGEPFLQIQILFDFFGQHFDTQKYTLALHSTLFSDLSTAISNEIETYLRRQLGVAAILGKALMHQLGYTMKQAAQALKDAHHAIDDVAGFIDAVSSGDPKAALRCLYDVGFDIVDVANSVTRMYLATADTVAGLLDDVGVPAPAIARAMQGAFSWTSGKITDFLKNIGGEGVDAIRAALEGVFESDVVENALSEGFEWVSDHANPSNW